ncbi:virulence RhuM family protein [Corynebacterium liangguodongii]|uniref:Uncharacterized protein n=1 Tax=Corynebacterium liangguodongii TaxID=2079535 RepID=A0A2S0WBF0_9CORY|nr:RhuM family protein [Corynebacterium liangguodongii]AWB83088.1 hypothetical protein C3E79_00105 [Corynebacterium liangguodongii]PWB99311.1 hypothetical protein DF219_06970 [Corynebacterium liangguodongii]
MTDGRNGEVTLYRRDDGSPAIEVRFDAETVWLNQQQIAELFETSRTNIVEHIKHVYEEGELDKAATCRKFRQVRTERSCTVTREIPFHNLDAIISVGYRVNSKMATQFCLWATQRLREYLAQGYAINERRLEQLGSTVQILSRSSDKPITGVTDVLASYLPGLALLRVYDEGQHRHRSKAGAGLYGDYRRGPVGYRTGGSEIPQRHFVWRRACRRPRRHHRCELPVIRWPGPLSDGRGEGSPCITNNDRAAITLMEEMSDPKEKDLIISLLVRMITEGEA